VKVSGYDVIGELQISFPLFFVPKIHLMTSYPETSTVKKLMKMWFFTIKIYFISSKNDPNITHAKNYIWG
jgi:hypothetical protein